MSAVKVGDEYGFLTVLELIPDRKNPSTKCICKCGAETYTQRGSLKNGKATSCGCKKAAEFIKRVTKHGMSNTPTYKTWRGMLGRCNNKNLPEYKNYGGRGIEVKWKSFEEFYADMGKKPKGYWIDRIDNNGNYEKNNCKWALPKVNQKNKRVSKFWVIKGKTYESSVEAAKQLNIDKSLVVRWCNGYTKNGKTYLPKEGYSSYLKYSSLKPLQLQGIKP
jgi:hypothetical protein